MSSVANKKAFTAPSCEILKITVTDVVTVSWGGGVMPIDAYEENE